jgi:hypothetical protein
MDPVVHSFSVSGAPAIQALLQLSRDENMPLGIIVGDGEICRTRVTYSAENTPGSSIVAAIVASVGGYTSGRTSGSQVTVVRPTAISPSTEQFLSLVDDRYAVKGNLPTLATMLWVHVRALLYPDEGTAGSILGSPADITFSLELTDISVERILDSIALDTKGVWILRPLPSVLRNLGSAPPFSIVSRAGHFSSKSDDLCSPAVADRK